MDKSKIREYRAGTFDKRVAYGQRTRKLLLVARGIMPGFKVNCRSEKEAEDLAYGLRLRSKRVERDYDVRFGFKVKVEGRIVIVIGIPKSRI